jgi:hypothetical protein
MHRKLLLEDPAEGDLLGDVNAYWKIILRLILKENMFKSVDDSQLRLRQRDLLNTVIDLQLQ